MEKVIQILMERDGVSRGEAINMIEETRDTIMEYLSVGDFDSAYNVIVSELNLEPDYIPDILY